jgi:hypothetical protein
MLRIIPQARRKRHYGRYVQGTIPSRGKLFNDYAILLGLRDRGEAAHSCGFGFRQLLAGAHFSSTSTGSAESLWEYMIGK